MKQALPICFVMGPLMLAALSANAQEPHFGSGEEMNIWYNPALKTNKDPAAQLHFKTVSYPGIIKYTSKAADIDLPLISRDATTTDNIFFADVSAGILTESSTDGFMTASTAMLSFSYALPLNDDNTYLALGFQGKYSFNRFGAGGSEHFPDGFDQYGAFGQSMLNDPYQSGNSYGYFTAGAGASVFHENASSRWYLGTSVLHFNKPYTQWNRDKRLSMGLSFQAGYNRTISERNTVGVFANIDQPQGGTGRILGAKFSHNLADADSVSNTINVGLSYRLHDALIPNIGLDWGRNRICFYYEFNVSPFPANGHRRAWSVSYRYHL